MRSKKASSAEVVYLNQKPCLPYVFFKMQVRDLHLAQFLYTLWVLHMKNQTLLKWHTLTMALVAVVFTPLQMVQATQICFAKTDGI